MAATGTKVVIAATSAVHRHLWAGAPGLVLGDRLASGSHTPLDVGALGIGGAASAVDGNAYANDLSKESSKIEGKSLC